MSTVIRAVHADITTLAVDVIVNAANSALLGGGGVDGAIHRAAGPELRQECSKLGGCNTGGAKITKGYRLPAKHIVHAVGPIWQGGAAGEAELLASCYRRSIELATSVHAQSIAVPSISTGIYGYPLKSAAPIAISTVRSSILQHKSIQEVIFCCFSSADLAIYESFLQAK